VAEVKTLGLTPQAEQRKLFPFMIYQALCHRQEGFVGILESDLARLALFGLLVPVQVCFFWQLLKFHEIDFFVAFGSIIMCFSLCLTIWAITKITLPRQIIFILITLYLALIGTWVSSGQFLPQLTVTQEILSPPRELLNTPIVTPFLEKLNKEELAGTERSQQQRSTDKTKTPAPETHDVFDGVYWLDLRGKSLAWANLSGSLLLKANLMGVDLQNSELKRTDLRYANLSNTYLKEVNFKDAKLSNTNLTRVYFQKDKPKSKYGDSYSNWIPVYKVGGENLCQAKTLAYAQMDDWLFKKLKTIKACNGKLKGVNTLPPTEES
jgi:hypothetical protein